MEYISKSAEIEFKMNKYLLNQQYIEAKKLFSV